LIVKKELLTMLTELRSSIETSVGKTSTREEYIRLVQLVMDTDRIVRRVEEGMTDGED
jgi:hypothetical protein